MSRWRNWLDTLMGRRVRVYSSRTTYSTRHLSPEAQERIFAEVDKAIQAMGRAIREIEAEEQRRPSSTQGAK